MAKIHDQMKSKKKLIGMPFISVLKIFFYQINTYKIYIKVYIKHFSTHAHTPVQVTFDTLLLFL